MPTLDLNANHYKEHSKSQYAQANSLLKTIEIKPNFSILDVGCGHGKIIAELSQLTPDGRSIGIDPSQNMISLATKTFPKSFYKNLEFHQIKAEKMNFKSNNFDLIICTNALTWIREPEKALSLMCKFLKVNGILIIFTYVKETPYVNLFEGVLREHFPKFVSGSAVNTILSVGQHDEILKRNGMSLDIFKLEDVVFKYKNAEDFKNYIRGWLPCYAPIPNELQESFLDKIIKESNLYVSNPEIQEITIPHKTLSIKSCKFQN